jgi:hypothetical protein
MAMKKSIGRTLAYIDVAANTSVRIHEDFFNTHSCYQHLSGKYAFYKTASGLLPSKPLFMKGRQHALLWLQIEYLPHPIEGLRVARRGLSCRRKFVNHSSVCIKHLQFRSSIRRDPYHDAIMPFLVLETQNRCAIGGPAQDHARAISRVRGLKLRPLCFTLFLGQLRYTVVRFNGFQD